MTKFAFFLLSIFALFSVYRLLPSGIHTFSDEMHIFRVYDYYLCLKDGQLPCRHTLTSGFGYGSPTANFYPPLLYLTSSLFQSFSISAADSLKLIIILSAFIKIFGAYLLAFLISKTVPIALLASTAYLFTPYAAVNIFVRGAFAENLALSLLPLVLYFLIKFIRSPSRLTFLAIIFLSQLFLLSHHLTVISTLPIFALFLIYNRKFIYKNLRWFLLYILFTFLLSAWFYLPLIFETSQISLSSLTGGYFNFNNHFASIYQLFIRSFWGYGASLWGPDDGLSFQVGYLHWFLPLLLFVYFLLKRHLNRLFLGFLGLGVFFLFLTHQRSLFIWQLFPALAIFQFPWRFLGPAVFCFSLSLAFLKLKSVYTYILVLLFIAFNLSFFRPDLWRSASNLNLLNPVSLPSLSGQAIGDYWYKLAGSLPTSPAPATPNLPTSVKLTRFTKSTSIYSFSYSSPNSFYTTLPLALAPQLYYRLDSIRLPPLTSTTINLPSGAHTFTVLVGKTRLQYLSEFFSLSSLVVMLLVLLPHDRKI
ncbi:MAG: hypothetical protein WCT01_01505 [Candidatus Shapirobacteria bacterium]